MDLNSSLKTHNSRTSSSRQDHVIPHHSLCQPQQTQVPPPHRYHQELQQATHLQLHNYHPNSQQLHHYPYADYNHDFMEIGSDGLSDGSGDGGNVVNAKSQLWYTSMSNVDNYSNSYSNNLNNNNELLSMMSQQQRQQHRPRQQQQQPRPSLHTGTATGSSLGRILDTPPSNSREMRNRAEKMRRDKINTLIGELAKQVPFVSNSSKRVDKTSVLRLSSSFLRFKKFECMFDNYQESQSHNNNASSPGSTTTTVATSKEDIPFESMIQLVCDQLGGFLMVLSTQGKIILVSHMVESLLGHNNMDLMGQSIFDISHSDDHSRLRHQLSHDVNTPNDESGGEMRRNFNIRMARARPRCEPVTYEPVSISGLLVPKEFLLCIVKVCRPPPLAERLLEASKDEYITRHLVDGRIINCDQRISVVAGYMSEEVAGLSAFTFMHREDVRWTMIALRQMYDRGESRGSSCYRLLSRTGQFIYLRTCGYLEVDSNGTVESFVCVNTLVSETEGRQLIQEMKARYSALIQPCDPLSLTNGDSTASVEDPQQLEVAIQYLMHKLPGSPSSPPPSSSSSSSSIKEIQDCNNGSSHQHSHNISNNNNYKNSRNSTSNNKKSACTISDAAPAAKRIRTESPDLFLPSTHQNVQLQPPPSSTTVILPRNSYKNSAHKIATIQLDRQIRKQQQFTLSQHSHERQNNRISNHEDAAHSNNIDCRPLDQSL